MDLSFMDHMAAGVNAGGSAPGGRLRPTPSGAYRKLRLLLINAQETADMTAMGLPTYESWIISATGIDASQLQVVNAAEGEALPAHFNFDGIIGGGSQHAAFEEADWIRFVRSFLQDAGKLPVPQLYLCWSHQARVLASGGTVQRGAIGRRFGVERLCLTRAGLSDPLFAGLPSTFEVFTSHTDVAVDLSSSPGEEPLELAYSDAYRFESLAYGPYVRTLQVHPEMTARMIVALARARRLQLVREGVIGASESDFDSFVTSILEMDERATANGRALMTNWINRFVLPAKASRKAGQLLEVE
jgi:GMP synthase (glutamine-hydrolysing)